MEDIDVLYDRIPILLLGVPFTIISDRGTCVQLVINEPRKSGEPLVAEKTGCKYRYMESLCDGHFWINCPSWVGFFEVPDAL